MEGRREEPPSTADVLLPAGCMGVNRATLGGGLSPALSTPPCSDGCLGSSDGTTPPPKLPASPPPSPPVPSCEKVET